MRSHALLTFRHGLLFVLLLAVVGALLFGLLRWPVAHTFELGAPDDTRYSTGFSVPETSAGTTFRWSLPESRLLLHGAGIVPVTLDLRLHHSQNPEARQHVSLERDGRSFAAFELAPPAGWRVYRVMLPPEALMGADSLAQPLTLAGTTYTPGDHDRRQLGVALDEVRVTPLTTLPATTAPLVVRSLFLTWVLALCWAGLWWLRGLFAARAGPLLIALLVYLPMVAAAGGLLAWVAWNPYMLAWALPAMVWLPGLATVALLALYLGRGTFDNAGVFLAWQPSARVALTLLGGVFLLALGLRFFALDSLPYGLWRDEAEHGLIALRMWEDSSYRPDYIARGRVNMPALGFYPFALSVGVWGINVWSMRVMTALGGALTVFPLYALVCRLWGRRDMALLAAALLAVSSWHLTISRFSFPTVFDPLLSLTGLWLLLVGLGGGKQEEQQQRPPWWSGLRMLALFGAGACLGVAAQTYHTGRLSPVVAGVLALLWLAVHRHLWRRWLAGMLSLLVGLGLAISPMAGYALRHPDSFNDRVGDVSLLSTKNLEGQAPLAVFDDSVGRHALMFHVQGDGNSRHHAPDRPLLDFVTGVGFLAGVVLLLARWRDWRSLFVFAALAICIAPSLLAVNGPHAMRSFDAVTFVCIIAALGWIALAGGLVRLLNRRANLPESTVRLRWLAGGLPGLVVVLALALNVWTYFLYMPTETRVWTSFYPVHTKIGTYLRNMANEEGPDALRRVYVAEHLTDNSVLRYLAHDLPIRTFSETELSQPAPPGALFVMSGYFEEETVAILRPYLDPVLEPVEVGPDLPGRNQPSFFVYKGR